MPKTKSKSASKSKSLTLSALDFFGAAKNRMDAWQEFKSATARLASADSKGAKTDALEKAVSDIMETRSTFESFWAYPGPAICADLVTLFEDGKYGALANSVDRVTSALMYQTFRQSPSAWDLDADPDDAVTGMPDYYDRRDTGRPYFEVLVVTSHATTIEQQKAVREAMMSLRRPEDPFIYELVFVANFEDAVGATLLNHLVQSVVIYDGFPFDSKLTMPRLRERLTPFLPPNADTLTEESYGMALTGVIQDIRPELDVFMMTNRNVEHLAAMEKPSNLKRIFYDVEELNELHLSILAGVQDRYDTPHFTNLQQFARRPVGTFHALPIARGRSIFKSHWIKDMGHFYGTNLFLAESSSTAGGLDSLLEPTGTIKEAQEKAARCFGAEHNYFVTNGTSTANKIVVQALCKPGDVVIVDRNCHKSHHYGFVLTGAQPYYVDAYPMVEYSMYGAVPLRTIKDALLKMQAEGKLDKVRMVLMTNCTFDGHIYNVQRVMEECLAIKPDLVFLWDEAWYAFARFSPVYRGRTSMGAVAALRERFASDEYRQEYEAFKKKVGAIDPKNKKLLDMRLYPDPDKVKLRAYATHSTHKSLSALRQGSMIQVNDEDYEAEVHEAFEEAFMTHTSTSPNAQIIASLDASRRQAELEGYEFVRDQIMLAMTLRHEVNTHPLISKYFRILTAEEMVPAKYRESGLKTYADAELNFMDMVDAWEKDEFVLDPTRLTLVVGTAGYDGTQFKNELMDKYNIQLNKTSRNSVLFQSNINNTRSATSFLIETLSEIAHKLDKVVTKGTPAEKAAFKARVKSLMEDVPDLPNFSHFADAYRDNAKSETREGHMRSGYFTAYTESDCEHVQLRGKEIDDRLKNGPDLVSANFVIPYPPGFPIMVPGQVITKEIIDFMRALDVKEIHGYNAAMGLKLIKPSALKKKRI
ncbi:MAG: aminotransferase class I/II-fold pyridoxal phosphate-dependent enzyme [Alphaproteobacteria bacterium]|nr:aminotransferase class I/II-fold pyridoxal phosphate-dependent enzyme [Alphaproteobacteria bacterium]